MKEKDKLQLYIKVNIKNKPKILDFYNVLGLFSNYYKYHTNLIENIAFNEKINIIIRKYIFIDRNEKLDSSYFKKI